MGALVGFTLGNSVSALYCVYDLHQHLVHLYRAKSKIDIIKLTGRTLKAIQHCKMGLKLVLTFKGGGSLFNFIAKTTNCRLGMFKVDTQMVFDGR